MFNFSRFFNFLRLYKLLRLSRQFLFYLSFIALVLTIIRTKLLTIRLLTISVQSAIDTINRFYMRNSFLAYVIIRGIFDITGEYLAREISSINSDVASQ